MGVIILMTRVSRSLSRNLRVKNRISDTIFPKSHGIPKRRVWKRLKGKNPEGKDFQKLFRRKQSSAKISRNCLKSSKSDILHLLRNLLRYLQRTFFVPRNFQMFLPFAFLPSGSFRRVHIKTAQQHASKVRVLRRFSRLLSRRFQEGFLGGVLQWGFDSKL